MSIIEELRQIKKESYKHYEDVELAYEEIILALKARAANGFNHAVVNAKDFSDKEMNALRSKLVDAGFSVDLNVNLFVIKWI